jgi:hypothetical protein
VVGGVAPAAPAISCETYERRVVAYAANEERAARPVAAIAVLTGMSRDVAAVYVVQARFEAKITSVFQFGHGRGMGQPVFLRLVGGVVGAQVPGNFGAQLVVDAPGDA